MNKNVITGLKARFMGILFSKDDDSPIITSRSPPGSSLSPKRQLPARIRETMFKPDSGGSPTLVERSKTKSPAVSYPSIPAVFVACSVLGALSYGRWYLLSTPAGASHPAIFFHEVLGWLACYYPWVLLAPLVFRLEHRLPLGGGRRLRNIFYLAGAGLFFSYAASELSELLALGPQLLFREPSRVPPHWWRPSVADLVLQLGIFATALATGYLFRKGMQLRQQEKLAAQLALDKSQLESSLRQAELETLRMRLNPHFLFNSLQNISILAQQDAKTASQMLARLGDLLRVALRRDSGPESTLETEIALTRAYASIEQMRFHDRLSVLFNVAPGTEQALVPTFLLQPLVENAIKHGLAGSLQQGLIAIGSVRLESALLITVRDNGSGLSSQGFSDLQIGIGLGSTSERLERMYPAQHQFSIHPLPEGGTEVRIVLPFKTKSSTTQTSYAETSSADR
jgi:two-component system, LytTR family, sensor kinase